MGWHSVGPGGARFSAAVPTLCILHVCTKGHIYIQPHAPRCNVSAPNSSVGAWLGIVAYLHTCQLPMHVAASAAPGRLIASRPCFDMLMISPYCVEKGSCQLAIALLLQRALACSRFTLAGECQKQTSYGGVAC